MQPTLRLLTCLLCLAVALVSRAEPPADHDLWYVIEMAGKRAGYLRNTQSTRDGRITTTTDTRITIKRGKTDLNITVGSVFVETTDGKPVSMKSTQEFGSAPMVTEWTFGPIEIAVVSTSGNGEPTKSTAPLPEGVWLPPAAAELFTQKRLEAGATTIELRTMDPSTGPVAYTAITKVHEQTTVEALGRTVPALKVTQTVSAMPGIETTAYIDSRGNPIRTTVNLGGIPMVILAADKDLALSKLEAPEIMQRTFVKPDKPIADPRNAKQAVFLLSVPDGQIGDIPSAAWQKVERIDDRTVRVRVDLSGNRDEALGKAQVAPAAEAASDQIIKPSSMLDSGDEIVRKLAAEATANAGTKKLERAEAMRRFVHTHISAKNLGVGFASASQVARAREGDCTEHGCLLAAMLRADGIPSRVASGLVFADAFAGSEHIFAYHMWTQGLFSINGEQRWIDLDATLPDSTPFDATHIALVLSPLADNQPENPLIALVPLLGRLQIKVEPNN